MARKKGKQADSKPRVVRIGPKPYKMEYFLRQIRKHESSINRVKRDVKKAKGPASKIEFTIIMHTWKIRLCESRIKLFTWFLGHGQEIGLEPNEKKVTAVIAKQQRLIAKARQAIGEAERRRKLKLRKPKN